MEAGRREGPPTDHRLVSSGCGSGQAPLVSPSMLRWDVTTGDTPETRSSGRVRPVLEGPRWRARERGWARSTGREGVGAGMDAVREHPRSATQGGQMLLRGRDAGGPGAPGSEEPGALREPLQPRWDPARWGWGAG